jgi:hypothetical protein
LKKRVVEDIRSSLQGGERSSSRGRADSESKKRVKINEVPEVLTKPPPTQVKKEELVSVSRVLSSHNGGSKTIVVLMPVGIPGMGKSTFIETQLRPYFEGM